MVSVNDEKFSEYDIIHLPEVFQDIIFSPRPYSRQVISQAGENQ